MANLDLGGLDATEIGNLMRLLQDTDVEECEVQQGDLSIALRRVVTPPAEMVQHEEPTIVLEDHAGEEPLFVASPAVGVFYRAEKHGGPPSVQAGARVEPGDILGVIEVIGVPHPVRSDREALVEDFLVEDGQAVEYGQPIVAISW